MYDNYHDMEWLPEIPEGLEPLSPNAGGSGEPGDLVGRKVELARLHEAVRVGGAHVTGERRMGKTWLVKKLQDDLADTVTAIYVSAETDSLELFSNRLLQTLRQNRIVGKKIKAWEMKLGGEIKLNIGIAGLTLTAKATKHAGTAPEQLDVLDLLSSPENGPVVLIIDEITHLCQALGPQGAREFLSGLRSRRQSGGPPLVISGSIGLHHALSDLRPINDLWTVEVGPLATDDAVILAARLLKGIGVEPTPRLVAQIVRGTSAIPYYIQAVVDQMRYRKDINVEAIIDECLTKNVWHTDHYDTRLDDYYGAERAACARAVLDIIAVSDIPLSIDIISSTMTARDPQLRLIRDEMLDLLDMLEKDHYLVREGDADRMSSALLSRIWRRRRRLP